MSNSLESCKSLGSTQVRALSFSYLYHRRLAFLFFQASPVVYCIQIWGQALYPSKSFCSSFWNHLILKVIIGRLPRQRPNSFMVSPIRIKTLEVRIQMRLKVANCIVREDKSFFVMAKGACPLS